MHPNKLGDATWIYVSPSRTIGKIDTKDRSQLHGRKQAGVSYADFPALTRREKKEAEVNAKDFVLREENGQSGSWRRLTAHLRVVRDALITVWVGRAAGTSGTLVFIMWRSLDFVDAWYWLG
eukprot:5843995-Heterocapsa_arctica.AAC.1